MAEWEVVPDADGWEAVPEEDYSLGTKALDLLKAGYGSAVDVNTSLLDLAGRGAMLPRATLEYAGQGVKNLFSDEPDPYEGTGMKDEIFDRTKQLVDPTIGRFNRKIREVKPMLEPEIPEGAAGEGFERWRTGAETAGSYAVPIPMGGGLNLARGAAGGVAGSIIGEEVGGESGKMIGQLSGDLTGTMLLRDPKQVLSMAQGASRTVKEIYNSGVDLLKSMVKKNKNDPGAIFDFASDSDRAAAYAKLLEAVEVPPEIRGNAKAYDEFMTEITDKIKFAVDAGEVGSIGQLTGNRGLLAFEEGLKKRVQSGAGTPQSVVSHTDQLRLDRELTERALDPIERIAPEGVASRATVAPAASLEKTKAALTQQADEAAEAIVAQPTQALEQAKKALPENSDAWRLNALNDAAPDGVQITKLGDEGALQLKNAYNKAYNDAWSNATSFPIATKRAILGFMDQAKKRVGAGAERSLENIRRDIDKLTTGVTPAKMKALDNTFRTEINKAAGGTMDSGLYDEILEMREAFRAGLPPSVLDDLAKVDAKYPSYLAAKKAGQAADIKNKAFTPEQLMTASRQVNRESPSMLKQARAGYSADEAAKVQLDELGDVVDTATAEAKALRKVASDEVKAIDRSRAGKFGATEGESVDAAVKNIMSNANRNKIKDIDALMATVKDNPGARDNIRRAFAEDFTNSVSKQGELTQTGLDTFKKRRPVYEKSGLFSKAELDKIEDGMVEAQKLWLHDPKYVANLPKGQRKVAEALAGLAGAKTGALAFGSPLIGAAYGRKFATQALEQITSSRVDDLAYELAVNPGKFTDEIARLKVSNIAKQEFDSIIGDMMKRIPVIGATQAEEIQ